MKELKVIGTACTCLVVQDKVGLGRSCEVVSVDFASDQIFVMFRCPLKNGN